MGTEWTSQIEKVQSYIYVLKYVSFCRSKVSLILWLI